MGSYLQTGLEWTWKVHINVAPKAGLTISYQSHNFLDYIRYRFLLEFASVLLNESFWVIFICGFGIDCHFAQSPASLSALGAVPVSRPLSRGQHVESFSRPLLLECLGLLVLPLSVDLKHLQHLLKRLKISIFPVWLYFAITAGKYFSNPGNKKLLPFGAWNQWVMYEN